MLFSNKAKQVTIQVWEVIPHVLETYGKNHCEPHQTTQASWFLRKSWNILRVGKKQLWNVDKQQSQVQATKKGKLKVQSL